MIGRDRNLVWPVELPSGYSMAGEIPATFVVRDKENGLEFRQTFSFRVLSSYTPDYLCVYQTPEGTSNGCRCKASPRLSAAISAA
ncbi:hypothetical protein [Segatella baroniae]|uniref:hypothetical protein n=1 Tax=Segatella baroniae TaxID=305719 RepID=UPI000471A19E|nr:hypothetical protein [Segatella baroniae]